MLDCRHNNLTKPALRVSTSTHSYTPNPPLSPAFSHTFKHNYHFRQKLNTGAVRFFKSIQKLKRGNNKNCSQNKQDRLNVFGCHNFLLSLLSAPCHLLTSLVLLIRYQLFLSNPPSGNLQYISISLALFIAHSDCAQIQPKRLNSRGEEEHYQTG